MFRKFPNTPWKYFENDTVLKLSRYSVNKNNYLFSSDTHSSFQGKS